MPASAFHSVTALFFMAASAFATLATAHLLTRISRPRGPVDALLLYWLYATADVVVVGNALSRLNALARPASWAGGAGISLFVVNAVVFASPRLRELCAFRGLPRLPLRAWLASFRRLPFISRYVLGILTLAFVVTTTLSVALVLFVAPHNWDSMAYHLARVGYFLQHGNFDTFRANYWAQVVHPRNGSLLLLYTFLASGRRESFFQLVQLVAYLVTIVAVYGIARRKGNRRSASLFAGLVFALLTEVLMEASTAQNDLLCTAYLGCATYFMLAAREAASRRHLLFAAMAIGLMIGVKSATLLTIPSLAVVALYTVLDGARFSRKASAGRAALLVTASFLAFGVLALPSGYYENIRLYRNAIGPASVRREHSFEHVPTPLVLAYGTKNVLRFGTEFLALDGFPPVPFIDDAQHALRYLPGPVLRSFGVDLAESEGVRVPIYMDKEPLAQEDNSYWGVLGFTLVWPVCALLLFGFGLAKSPSPHGRAGQIFALAALLFTLAQSYSGPYDRWRGRYFILVAVFAVPPVARCLTLWRGAVLSKYLALVATLGAVSGVCAVLFRQNTTIWPVEAFTRGETCVFSRDRLEQITSVRPAALDAFRRFEELVPADATVGVLMPPDSYEYPLFGEHLTRRLEPIDARSMTMPRGASYLVFASVLLRPTESDTFLGEDMYLRALRVSAPPAAQ